MASHARDILNYKNFKDCGGDNKVAEQCLIKEKAGNKNKIPYIIHPSKQYAGKFMLSYMPRNSARHEYVTVTPDGFRYRKQNFESMNQLIKWFKENYRAPIPGTPMASPAVRGNRTPYGATGRSTPGQRPGITPGAMSMAGTPYGGTPGGAGRHNAAPYTPTANTPFMTPVHTPGGTPRGYGGGTPKAGFPGSTTPRSSYGGATPRGVAGGGNLTPGQNTPSFRQSAAGNAWAAAAENWPGGRRTPGGGGRGYSTTPRYDNDPRRTPKYGGGTPSQQVGGNRSMPPPPGGRPPMGGGRTPNQHGGGGRTPQYSSGRSESGRTPRGQFGDSTPLYDE